MDREMARRRLSDILAAMPDDEVIAWLERMTLTAIRGAAICRVCGEEATGEWINGLFYCFAHMQAGLWCPIHEAPCSDCGCDPEEMAGK